MASTGFTAFGTAAHVAGAGPDWSDVDNALTDDTDAATAPYTAFQTCDLLRLTNLSLSVPASATLDGIEVRFRRYKTGGTINDSAIFLYDDGRVGDNKSGVAAWGNSAAAVTFGGSADLWGTSLTPADVNASTFGFELSWTAAFPSTGDSFVEFAEINVHYTALAVNTRNQRFAWLGYALPFPKVFAHPDGNDAEDAEERIMWLYLYPGVGFSATAPLGSLPSLGVGR